MQRERNREGWTRADEPDTAEGDDPEAAIRFVGEVCARAATVGEDGVGDAQWRSAVKAVESGDAVRRRRGWWLPDTGCAPL